MQECFAPCDVGNVSSANFSQGKLSDDEREDLLEILEVITLLDDGEIQMLSQVTALTKLALEVFTTLTNHHQSLTVEEEMEIVALVEKALKPLAGSLELGNCVDSEVVTNSAYFCHDTSENIKSRSNDMYMYEITQTGTSSENFKERLKFDLQSDNGDISFVVLRTENKSGVRGVNMEPTGSDGRAAKGTKFIANSAILAFSLFVEGIKTSVPVSYSLYHHKKAQDDKISIQGDGAITRQPICAFWHENNLKWSTKGCRLAREKSVYFSDCICSHSTSFVVILKVTSNEDSEFTLELLTNIGFGASIFGLVCTLAIFFYLRKMLQSDRIFMHSNLAAAILAAQILFLLGIDKTENEVACKIIALFLHFFFLSIFGWMLVEGVHLYMKVVKVYGSENIKVYRYVLIGWVTPAVICSISFAANNNGYGTERSCWLDTDTGMIWAFAAPMLVVALMNMIVLVAVLRIVMKSAQLQNNNRLDHIKCGAKGAMVLLPILGVTWLFGLMNSVNIVFQYLFTILNSFQGLFIFFIQCIFNSEVQAAVSRKRAQHELELGVTSNSQDNTQSRKSFAGKMSTFDTKVTDSNLDCSEECTEMTQTGSSVNRQGVAAATTGIPTTKMKRPISGKVAPMMTAKSSDLDDF